MDEKAEGWKSATLNRVFKLKTRGIIISYAKKAKYDFNIDHLYPCAGFWLYRMVSDGHF
jgi:hypothetical protein